MTMALSYNPVTRITSGFCGYTSQRADKDKLIEHLKQAKSNAHHPMLLPALTYGIFWDRLRGQVKDVRVERQKVQDRTGLLKDYLKLPNNEHLGNKEKKKAGNKAEAREHRGKKGRTDYDQLHKLLVEQQARMTNVSDLGPACHNALSVISDNSSGPVNPSGEEKDTNVLLDDEELQTYIQYLWGAAKIELQYRDQLLSRVNMQLKVVCRFSSPLGSVGSKWRTNQQGRDSYTT
jgi:hypothetical protein